MTVETMATVGRRELLAMVASTGAGVLIAGTVGSASSETTDNDETLRTIGVLGGIGPQATMDFEVRVHRAAQRLIPPRQNSSYPPMVVYYHRHPPFAINADLSPKLPLEPHPALIAAARRLGAWADFLVITSNGAHLMQDQIQQASGLKVLSIVDVTLDYVASKKWQRVGVVGLGAPRVYTQPLDKLGIAYETIDGDMRTRLDAEIMKVMEGRDNDESRSLANEVVASLRARKVDGVILGCTEIPLLLPDADDTPDLVNPGALLAEAAVRQAQAARTA